jgi:hypothetical protein
LAVVASRCPTVRLEYVRSTGSKDPIFPEMHGANIILPDGKRAAPWNAPEVPTTFVCTLEHVESAGLNIPTFADVKNPGVMMTFPFGANVPPMNFELPTVKKGPTLLNVDWSAASIPTFREFPGMNATFPFGKRTPPINPV